MNNSNEVNAIKELSIFNKSAEILVKLLHKGVESGDIGLSDNNNVATFRSLSQSLCDVSQFFLKQASHPIPVNTTPIETVQVVRRSSETPLQ
jgi:hypothetical protein